MAWKPEYALNRKKKEIENPEFRLKRMEQAKPKDQESRKEYMREYVKQNREKFRRTPEQQAKYNEERRKKYAECAETRDLARKKVKEWQQANPHKRKEHRILKYGLTLDQFNQMLEAQGMKCAICGYSDMSNKNNFPLVDHCHSTGKVRGLLCMNCNQALGKFKDSLDNLKAAIAYLSNQS